MEGFDGTPPAELIGELELPRSSGVAIPSADSEIEREVMDLFERFRDSLLRYGLSLGVTVHDAEEVVQETFLALFRHLQLGRSRANLRGWIFRVTHNLTLKQRYAQKRMRDGIEIDETIAGQQVDPSPSPEEHLSSSQRQRRLLAVVRALPEIDQSCLRLRAEGLRYREIAAVLRISLGTVSMSLTRSFARLSRADERG